MSTQPLLIWIRQGDIGEYESADSIADLDFAERKLGKFKAWQRFGFSTDTHEGRDYVSLYWGDKEAEPVRYLTREEKIEVERLVNEAGTPGQTITKPVGVTLQEFFDLFDEEVHDALRAQLKKPYVRGIVCFENLALDSSHCGERTALIYGDGCTYWTLPGVLCGRLGDVPSRFQYPVKYFVKPV